MISRSVSRHGIKKNKNSASDYKGFRKGIKGVRSVNLDAEMKRDYTSLQVRYDFKRKN